MHNLLIQVVTKCMGREMHLSRYKFTFATSGERKMTCGCTTCLILGDQNV